MTAPLIEIPPELHILSSSTENEAGDLQVRVRTFSRANQPCPFCGSITVSNGTRIAKFRDVPFEERRVTIVWAKQRRLCRSGCGRSSLEQNVFFDENRQMTKRLMQWIADKGTTATFGWLSKATGLDVATISSAFAAEAVRSTSSELMQSAVIAIEGFVLVGQIRPVLYASRSQKLLDIAEDTDELEIGERQWRCERLIMPATPEFWTLRRLVNWRTLVIGRQSLVEYADLLLAPKIEDILRIAECPSTDSKVFFRTPESLRRVARKRVRYWKDHCPLVASAYALKVAFSNIWHLDRNDRNRTSDYGRWRTDVMNSDEPMRKIFGPVCDEIDRQQAAIFGFYDDPHWRLDDSGAQWVRGILKSVRRTHSFGAAAAGLLQSQEVL